MDDSTRLRKLFTFYCLYGLSGVWEALISMDGVLPFTMAFHGGLSELALMMWPEVCFML